MGRWNFEISPWDGGSVSTTVVPIPKYSMYIDCITSIKLIYFYSPILFNVTFYSKLRHVFAGLSHHQVPQQRTSVNFFIIFVFMFVIRSWSRRGTCVVCCSVSLSLSIYLYRVLRVEICSLYIDCL